MICKATPADCHALAELALLLWNEHSIDELIEEFSESLRNDNTAFFLTYVDAAPVGFAQCGLRCDYVEGTETSPVGYLEGIFVKAEHRHKGYAAELLTACEAWARSMGCTEFASDCELENTDSLQFHLSVGFTEANRVICFTKKL